MMTIKTFKSLCLKAGTKKADQIHEYYIKMEEILQETIGEECAELKLQLEETEFLCREKLSFEQLDTIISSIEYSPANYQKLLDENEHLLKENLKLSNALKVIKEEFKPEVDTEKTKHHYRQPDGLYHIFTMLCGTRQEVWDNKAYKTVGGLTKHDLIMNNLVILFLKLNLLFVKVNLVDFLNLISLEKNKLLLKKMHTITFLYNSLF